MCMYLWVNKECRSRDVKTGVWGTSAEVVPSAEVQTQGSYLGEISKYITKFKSQI